VRCSLWLPRNFCLPLHEKMVVEFFHLEAGTSSQREEVCIGQ